METLLNALKISELFSSIPHDVLVDEILPNHQIQEYQKGQFLIEPQQKVDSIGIVLSGKVHIMHLFPQGNYSLMSVLTVGKALSADLVCTRSRISPYHAVAASPVRVAYFPANLFCQVGLLTEQWRLAILNRLLTLISNENMKKEYRLAILSQKGLRERIVTYLTMQAARQQKCTFPIPFSREELAAFLCVNRSALSHELSLMQNEGLISFRKNIFAVKNLPLY